jgi:hypothetical protein
MTSTPDPRVDASIAALPAWQQAICQEVRELIHAADPEVVETVKRRVQPYFVLEGNIYAGRSVTTGRAVRAGRRV